MGDEIASSPDCIGILAIVGSRRLAETKQSHLLNPNINEMIVDAA
jgi:hypothetical protein